MNHGLSENTVQRIREVLARFPEVETRWIGWAGRWLAHLAPVRSGRDARTTDWSETLQPRFSNGNHVNARRVRGRCPGAARCG